MPAQYLAGWALTSLAWYAVFNGWHRRTSFQSDNCAGLYQALRSDIVGQDWALGSLAAQICDHIEASHPSKPLVVSVHGPPGVGKTMFHRQLARALYSIPEPRWAHCPGEDCPAYRVLFSMSYVAGEREAQAGMLRDRLVEHLDQYPQSLVVIEEYDKADPASRGVLRQLIDGGRAANISLERAIFVLESNTGFLELAGMAPAVREAEEAGLAAAAAAAAAQGATTRGRKAPPPPPSNTATPEDLMRRLKDIVYLQWKSDECPQPQDSCASLLKTVNLIDSYVPFLPLRRGDIRRLVSRLLERRRDRLLLESGGRWSLTWDPSAVEFLVGRVEFDGEGHAVEGGKEASSVVSRYVKRALNEPGPASELRAAAAEEEAKASLDPRRYVFWGGKPEESPPLRRRLAVAPGERGLVVQEGDGELGRVGGGGPAVGGVAGSKGGGARRGVRGRWGPPAAGPQQGKSEL